MESKPGSRLGGYQILATLGAGSMGTVYRARQLSLGREVALKVFSSLSGDPTDEIARFLREGRIQARLSHPNLVKVHDHGEEGPWLYIAMELIPGRSLESILAADRRLPVKRAMAVMREVVEALEYLHRSEVQHRDIKPGNILVDGSEKVYLADFGLARSRDDTLLTRDTQMLGTLAYMAPEVLEGGERDAAADIWSAGVVLYRMLAGDFPHFAENPGEFFVKVAQADPPPFKPELEIPGALASICSAMLHKDPAKRPPAARLREKLRAVRLTATVPRYRATVSVPVEAIREEPPRTGRARLAVAAIVLLFAAGGLAAWRAGAPVPRESPASPAGDLSSGTPTIGADDPRTPLLERYRARLSSMPVPGRLVAPETAPRTVAEWFWHERARLDRIDPASLRGWFLVLEVTGLTEVTLHFDGRDLAHPPDRGVMNRALLRVNGTAVVLEVQGPATWSGRVPPSALRPGLNHWSLIPDPGIRSAARVRLELVPSPAPGSRPPAALSIAAPSPGFRQDEEKCLQLLRAGVFLESKSCFGGLLTRHPDRPWAMWQIPLAEVLMARGVRDLDSAMGLPTGHELLPGNVRDPDQAGIFLAVALDALQRSLKIEPAYGMTWRILGEALHTAGEKEMGWAAVMFACLVRPEDPAVWIGPGALYQGVITPSAEMRTRRSEIAQATRAGLSLDRTVFGEPLTQREVQLMKDMLRVVELDGARAPAPGVSASPRPAGP